MKRPIHYLCAIVFGLAWLFLFATADGQTTLTLTGNATWSTLSSSYGTAAANLANTSIILGNYTLTLDGTNQTYSMGGVNYPAATYAVGTGYLIPSSTLSQNYTINAPLGMYAGNHALLTVASTQNATINTSEMASPNYATAPLTVSGTANINGTAATPCVLLYSDNAAVVTNNGAILNLVYCNIQGSQVTGGGIGAVSLSGASTRCYLTNCNILNSKSQAFVLASSALGPIIVSANANNYTQYATATGTIQFPAAATIVGPWPISNNATGSIRNIGPHQVIQKPDGTFTLEGIGPIH